MADSALGLLMRMFHCRPSRPLHRPPRRRFPTPVQFLGLALIGAL
jgi:hypothetical protein